MVKFVVARKEAKDEKICIIGIEKDTDGVYVGIADEDGDIDTYLLKITEGGIELCDYAENDFVKTYNGYVVVKKE